MSVPTPILSNPYYLYPGWPLSGYSKYDTYNDELIRLNDFLVENMDPVTTFIAIGTPWEEYIHIEGATATNIRQVDSGPKYQYRQLFPWYFEKLIIDRPEMAYQVIIISPDDCLNHYEPEFISKTMDRFGWTLEESGRYISTIFNVTVQIFHTMMPTVETNARIAKANKCIKKLRTCVATFNSPIQTTADKTFVSEFYHNLMMFAINKISLSAPVMIHSYAVFKQHSNICNYSMFKELRQLSNCADICKNTGMFVLAEWLYSSSCFTVNQHNRDHLIAFWEPAKELSKSVIDSDAVVPHWNAYGGISMVKFEDFMEDSNIDHVFESVRCETSDVIHHRYFRITERVDMNDLDTTNEDFCEDIYASKLSLKQLDEIMMNSHIIAVVEHLAVFISGFVSAPVAIVNCNMNDTVIVDFDSDEKPLVLAIKDNKLYYVSKIGKPKRTRSRVRKQRFDKMHAMH